MASGEPSKPAQTDREGSPEPGRVASEIADPSFPVSVRGYDRGAVDAYVSRVDHVVAELESTRSPETAVKQALEEVGEETKRILEQAGETAEQIAVAARHKAEDSSARAEKEAETVVSAAKAEAAEILDRSQADADATITQARTKAAEHLQRVRAEAAAVREEAEARLRELQANMETIQRERSHLLDDVRDLATRVAEVARIADERFPPPDSSDQPEEGNLQADAAEEDAAADETATDRPTAEAGTRKRSSA